MAQPARRAGLACLPALIWSMSSLAPGSGTMPPSRIASSCTRVSLWLIFSSAISRMRDSKRFTSASSLLPLRPGIYRARFSMVRCPCALCSCGESADTYELVHVEMVLVGVFLPGAVDRGRRVQEGLCERGQRTPSMSNRTVSISTSVAGMTVGAVRGGEFRPNSRVDVETAALGPPHVRVCGAERSPSMARRMVHNVARRGFDSTGANGLYDRARPSCM
mgnify:CR=1 FL=1